MEPRRFSHSSDRTRAEPELVDEGGSEHHLTVEERHAGARLDAFIADQLDLSRTRSQALIAQGLVQVDGRPPKKSDSVAEGQAIHVRVPAPAPSTIQAEDIPLDVVFEDEALLVVNKPAGLVVHPAPGHFTGTLVNALLGYVKDLSGIGGTLRPGIVHRLDKDTSGLLVVAKKDNVHTALSEAIQRREVKRFYKAASWGHLRESPILIDAPVGRDPKNRQRMSVHDGGRHAVTHVTVAERWEAAELLDVALRTGRTHQIRVHLAHLGHPVAGDSVYGVGWEKGMGGSGGPWAREFNRRVPRQFLHACMLAFTHPLSGKEMKFEAPIPEDLESAVEWARCP